MTVRGKPSRMKPLGAVLTLQSSLDDGDDEGVGNERPAIHVAFGVAAERRVRA